jgi:hypothetical protein
VFSFKRPAYKPTEPASKKRKRSHRDRTSDAGVSASESGETLTVQIHRIKVYSCIWRIRYTYIKYQKYIVDTLYI